MTDRDPWRPLVGEPTEDDFDNAYDGDAELDATIRARRRRRRIAVITAGGALTFAIGGSLVLPEGDADAPVESPAATLASADRQPTDSVTDAVPEPEPEPDSGTSSGEPPQPLPVSLTIDLPPELAGAATPFDIVAVTPSEVHRVAVPSGEVRTRQLVDEDRFRTGSFSVVASPTMAAVRIADDSVTLVPDSEEPFVDWPADTFGAPDQRRTTVVSALLPGTDDRFIVTSSIAFQPEPGDPGPFDAIDTLPDTDRFVATPGFAAPFDSVVDELPDVPGDMTPIGSTGWWLAASPGRDDVAVVSPLREVTELDGALVGAGTDRLVVQVCAETCRLDVYGVDAAADDPTLLQTLDGDGLAPEFAEPLENLAARAGSIADDGTVMLESVAGVVDLRVGSIAPAPLDWLLGPFDWVPDVGLIVRVDRSVEGISLVDPLTGETTTFGAELGRPVGIATARLD